MVEKHELDMEELRKIQLEMLCEIDSFCRENKLTYYLSNGTLLGAVKYKGFIPWDDDIDILMPRKDYDSFVGKYVNTACYSLFSIERNRAYRFPFAKFCDTRTVKNEFDYNNGVQLGVDIDVFPIDSANSFEDAVSTIKKSQELMNQLFWTKIKILPSRNPVFTAIKACRILAYRAYGASRVCRRMIANAKKEVGEAAYKGCFVWPVYAEREIIPAEAFTDTVLVAFEGCQFPAPVGYDTYLRSLYGDYWQDPPPEKQKTHHDFKAYRL
jgi:lipopolysaccharide cholinephosphotransferase